MATKQCRICQVTKPLESFFARKGAKDGRNTECRECTMQICKKWKEKNIDKVKQYKTDYYSRNADMVNANSRLSAQRRRLEDPEKARVKYRKWYHNNKDKAKLASENWCAKNPNWHSLYAIENKEKISKRHQEWAKNNKGLVREKSRRYQAQKRGATPPWLTAIHRAQIQEMYDVAVALEVQTGVPHHVDHIHPLQGRACCGLHVPWNLQILSQRENISKSNKMVGEL